jgi:hypothetical protein
MGVELILERPFRAEVCVIRNPRALPWADMSQAFGLEDPVADRSQSFWRAQANAL